MVRPDQVWWHKWSPRPFILWQALQEAKLFRSFWRDCSLSGDLVSLKHLVSTTKSRALLQWITLEDHLCTRWKGEALGCYLGVIEILQVEGGSWYRRQSWVNNLRQQNRSSPISLISIRNISGFRTIPWGTSDLTLRQPSRGILHAVLILHASYNANNVSTQNIVGIQLSW